MNDVERASKQGISRRTVAKAMAWSAPAIAVAATVPVAAASCVQTTSFDDLRPGTRPSTLTFLPSQVTATVTRRRKNGQVGYGASGEVARTTTNPAWSYIEMQMSGRVDRNDWVELTFHLSEPVEGLSFIIHDIDKSNWIDTAYVSPAGFTASRGSNITGAGTSSNPFQPIAWGDTPINEGAGRVRVTWPGTVQTVTVRYVAGQNSSSNQHIGIGDLSYEACLPRTKSSAASPQARSLMPSGRLAIDANAAVPEPSQTEAQTDS
ncbi:hypothetical protein WDU99_13505 [Microbacterium sp. Mu-80]|uniref:Uncharacterized protein n=1 Tax=Microbacterium bandirmense TaxID=3122050 RepID=A0ABU8LDC5_9MICO